MRHRAAAGSGCSGAEAIRGPFARGADLADRYADDGLAVIVVGGRRVA